MGGVGNRKVLDAEKEEGPGGETKTGKPDDDADDDYADYEDEYEYEHHWRFTGSAWWSTKWIRQRRNDAKERDDGR